MRRLSFLWKSTSLELGIEKLDRRKVYGYVEERVTDEHGSPCEVATLAPDGQTIIPKGGTGLAYVNADGEWMDRDDLTAVTVEYDEIVPMPSSFDAPIVLEARATADDVLSTSARLVYDLTPMGAPVEDPDGAPEPSPSLPADLLAELEGGAIFTFPFAYRESLKPDTGFLLAGAQGGLFLLACTPLAVSFATLASRAPVVEDDEAAADDDTLSFDML